MKNEELNIYAKRCIIFAYLDFYPYLCKTRGPPGLANTSQNGLTARDYAVDFRGAPPFTLTPEGVFFLLF